MWKKKIAVLMAAAMITGMSGMTVFAEEQQGGGAPQMEQQLQQAPQGEAPAGQPPQGEAPQAPVDMGQQPPQGEAPANNEQQPSQDEASQSSQGAAPQMEQKHPGRGKMNNGQRRQDNKGRASRDQAPGKMDHRNPFIDFEACVKDGTISQETYDAIKKYMDENKPERPTDGGEEGTDTEVKEGERPEDGTNTEMKEDVGSEMEKPDLLKDLLDAEVITQDEYDALAKRSDDVKEGSAQEEKAAGTEEDKEDIAPEEKPMAAQEDKEADAKDEKAAQTDKTT